MTTLRYGNANDLSVDVDNSIGDTVIVGNGATDSVSAFHTLAGGWDISRTRTSVHLSSPSFRT